MLDEMYNRLDHELDAGISFFLSVLLALYNGYRESTQRLKSGAASSGQSASQAEEEP